MGDRKIMDNRHIKEFKKAETYKKQVDILKSRNLIINNDYKAIEILKKVNYYRLSAYMLTHKQKNGEYNNLSIQDVYSLYQFDKELRNLLLLMIENIEIAFRTHISYLIGHTYGPLGYKNKEYFKSEKYHEKMLGILDKELNESDEIFVKHHSVQYKGIFPVWVAIEVTSFGFLSKMYSNLLDKDKDIIARTYYNVPGRYVKSWLHSLTNVRNKCAHYGRLYNKKLNITPRLFKSSPKQGIKNDTLFANIYIMGKLSLDKKEWKYFVEKLKIILERYEIVDKKFLGFPDDWKYILINI